MKNQRQFRVTFLKHPDGRATVAPVHSSETIGSGLLRAILRDVEMSVDSPSIPYTATVTDVSVRVTDR
jgi:hypothetical protein